MQTQTLSNNVTIPTLGFGTWCLTPDTVAENAVIHAINCGYRHIDTAIAYENENGVGDAIAKSNITRDDLFITSKIPAEVKNNAEATRCIDASLKRLKLDYLDLMLIHCPQPWAEFGSDKRYFHENIAVWCALEDAYRAGKIRTIGVSNFDIDDITNIIDNCTIAPMVNQIEVHIGRTPNKLIAFCRDNNIAVEAYSPIAHGRALNNPTIIAMAEKYHVSAAQLCIAYTLALGLISLPKATSPEHIAQNYAINFTITNEDMNALHQLG